MNMSINRFGMNTLNVITDLKNDGVNSMAVLMRHSARRYDMGNFNNEPFMGLTAEGKELSYKFGEELPTDYILRLFSSPVGRCIETAYQIEKGSIFRGGKTETNKLSTILTAFYVRDFQGAIERMVNQGTSVFFRDWFSGRIPLNIMDDPEKSAMALLGFLVGKLNDKDESRIDIFVSHDWNLYIIKEYYLSLPQEEVVKAEYLEGVIVYRKNGELYITDHQNEPEILRLS